MSFAKDYVEVSERIGQFRQKHPEGTLQADIHLLTDTLVVMKAYAYRTPDDPRPGVGWASEPIPGKTNFTRDSEVQNAETSAWGRAIIAVGAADAKRGVASADEVRNRQADAAAPPPPLPSDQQIAVLDEWLDQGRNAGLTNTAGDPLDFDRFRSAAVVSAEKCDAAVRWLTDQLDP